MDIGVVLQCTPPAARVVDLAKRAVDALRLSDLGVHVTYSGPLWRSERIATLVSTRIMALVADPAASGVVLVGQGQPDDRTRDRSGWGGHRLRL